MVSLLRLESGVQAQLLQLTSSPRSSANTAAILLRASSAGAPGSTGAMSPPAGAGPPHTPLNLRGGLSSIGEGLLRTLSPTSESLQVIESHKCLTLAQLRP